MWNLDQDDNFALSLDGGGFENGEVVCSIAFNKSKGNKIMSFVIVVLSYHVTETTEIVYTKKLKAI